MIQQASPVDWPTSRRIAYDSGSPGRIERVALGSAIGLVAATDVVAPYDVAHYASSAMDGWVVAGEPPWNLTRAPTLEPGEARGILTGQEVPAGADRVLRSEHGRVDRSGVLEPNDLAGVGEPRPGGHVRPAGDEARRGEVVIRAGSRLNPAHIGVAAACGVDALDVIAAPMVALVLTGAEVVATGIPLPGQVRDSFGPQVPAVLAMLGGRGNEVVRVGDSLAATVAAITDAPSDVIMTIGGTGGSAADQVNPALRLLGATRVISGIRMRPGSPTTMACLPDGRQVIALPGNPLAAMMGLLTVAEPLLRALGGRERPTLGSTRVAEAVAGRRSSTRLVPYLLGADGARPTGRDGSGMMRGLASAAGVLVVPPAGIEAGGVAETLQLPWD